MSTLAHNSVFTSYSAPAKAPAPAAERVVHSTMFSAYDVASASVALASVAPAQVAQSAPAAPARKSSLLGHWEAWRAARKSAREERELWALARGDARVMSELNCLMARAS